MRKRWIKRTAAALSLTLVINAAGTGLAYGEPVVTEDTVVVEELDIDEEGTPLQEADTTAVEPEISPTELGSGPLVIRGAAVSGNLTSDYDGMEIPPLNYIDDGYDAPSVGESAEQLVGVSLPSSYRATAEERTDLTPIRSQNPYGDCWTFGTLASGEQTFIKNSESQNAANTDLAEIQLAWFTYNDNTTAPCEDPASPYGDITQDTTVIQFNGSYSESEKAKNIYNMGGGAISAAWTLARGIGAASEIEEPDLAYANFDDDENTYGLDNRYAYLASARLRDMYAVNIKEDQALAKQLIMDYGTITASYYSAEANYATPSRYHADYIKDKSFCDARTDGTTNHAVAIVGWDDDYAVSNFTGAVHPQNPGAWLVRNSWGADWGGMGGYFWMSYETGSLKNNYVMNMEPVDTEERNYQYDGLSTTWSCPLMSGGSICNVFQAAGTRVPDKREVIERVAFAVEDTNVDYSIQIYKNPTDSQNPTSGTAMLAAPVEGHLIMAGYQSVDLPCPLHIAANDKFAVVVTLDKDGGGTLKYWADGTNTRVVKNDNNTQVGTCTYTSHMEAGQSFQKYSTRNSWTDQVSTAAKNTPRLKAFTRLVDYIPDTAVSMNQTTLSLGLGEQETLSANVLPSNATEQELTWSSSNPLVATVAANGTVTGVRTGSAVITATSPCGNTAICQVTITAARATVSFVTNGGSTVAARKYTRGEAFGMLPTPVYNGFDFKGWYLDEALTSSKRVTGSSIVPDTDTVTLYAKWQAAPYVITFDAENGQTPETANYIGTDTLGTLPTPTYGQRTFTGWYTQRRGVGTRLTSSMRVSTLSRNAVVYGSWSYVPCTSLSSNSSVVSVDIGKKTTNTAVLYPADATCAGITYQSMDTGIFKIDQNGRITGKSYGTAECRILANVVDADGNDIVKECRFTVQVEDQIGSIEAVTSQTQAKTGTAVNKSAMRVYACNQSGRYLVSENQFTVTPETITKKGDNLITVAYSAAGSSLTTQLIIRGTDSTVSEDTPADLSPRMQQKLVAVNRSLERQGSFIMEKAVGTEQLAVDTGFYEKNGESYQRVQGLTLTCTAENKYEISAADTYKNSKKLLYVKADVTSRGVTSTFYVPITVQVISKMPSIKLKTAAINVFYTDEESRTSTLAVTNPSGVSVTGITLDENLAKWFEVQKNPETDSYEIHYAPSQETASVKNIIKKGKAKVYLEGYETPVLAALSITVKMQAPSLKSLESPAVLNLSEGSSLKKPVYILDKTGVEQAVIEADFVDSSMNSYFDALTVSEGAILLSAKSSARDSFAKAKNLKLNVRAENWLYKRPVSVKFQIKEGTPAAKLSAKQITFNHSYRGAKASAYLDFDTDLGSSGYLVDDTIYDCTDANAATAPLLSVKQCSPTRYQLTASALATTKAGTYTYTILPKLADGKDLNLLKLKIKVTENTKAAQVIMKTVKGSKFDLLMGENAGISYTMTCKNINAKVTDVSVTDDTSDFEAKLVSDLDGTQVMRIGLKENKKAVAGSRYEVPVAFVIRDVGNQLHTLNATMKFKAVEGSLKFKLSVPAVQLSRGVTGSYIKQKVGITAPEGAEFASLLDVSENLPEGAFYVFASPVTGTVRITLRDAEKVETGKTYVFTFAAKAGYGTKTVKQKMKITITD